MSAIRTVCPTVHIAQHFPFNLAGDEGRHLAARDAGSAFHLQMAGRNLCF